MRNRLKTRRNVGARGATAGKGLNTEIQATECRSSGPEACFRLEELDLSSKIMGSEQKEHFAAEHLFYIV